MKKIIALFVFSLLYPGLMAQEGDKKFAFYSTSISPLGAYFDDHTGGATFSLDAVFKKEKHLLKAFISLSGELSIFSDSIDANAEFDLLYGRELFIKEWLYVDFFAGVGYFIFEPANNEKEHTIGFPLQTRIRFQTGDRFGVGIQIHTNINSANTIYSTGIFLQWRF